MRLTTFTDYTIRVLLYMGLHPDELTTVGELAQRYEISRNHLTKVIHYLGQHGYIETLRGRGGGIRLATRPADINIGALVRETEKNSMLVECFTPAANHCKITPACRLSGILREAQEAFYQVLGKYSVADLITNPAALDKLLEL
jgi:Rrf2 family nitric oxide-sensitive transcriptional repressor